MSLGTYNRARANRITGTQTHRAQMAISARVTAVASLGVRYQGKTRMYGELTVAARVGHGYRVETGTMTATVNATIAFAVKRRARMAATGATTATAAAGLRLPLRYAGAMTVQSLARARVRAEMTVAAACEAAAHATGVRTAYRMRLENLVIPAGGVLVIDGANYTITLNGVNVIDQYEGDWVQITRETKVLSVVSGTGRNIDVALQYTERYL